MLAVVALAMDKFQASAACLPPIPSLFFWWGFSAARASQHALGNGCRIASSRIARNSCNGKYSVAGGGNRGNTGPGCVERGGGSVHVCMEYVCVLLGLVPRGVLKEETEGKPRGGLVQCRY